ncbi:MAG: hypothetical protein NVS4B1_33440 [Ktedonobacteraceae bacterium]
MGFTITMSGLTAMQSRFSIGRDGLGVLMRDGTAAIELEAVNGLHAACPVDNEADNGVIPGEEGHLDESFVGDPVMASVAASHAEVRTQEPIKFQYVTQGTASPILPTVKKAMWWPGAAHPMYSVAGQAADPFQTAVAQDIQGRMDAILAPYLQHWLSRLIG